VVPLSVATAFEFEANFASLLLVIEAPEADRRAKEIAEEAAKMLAVVNRGTNKERESAPSDVPARQGVSGFW
jgi:hypothetical protein